MGTFVEDYTTQVNLNDMSKLISKMDSLQTSYKTIQNRGLYKPKVTPYRGRHYGKPMNVLLISEDLMVEKNSLGRTDLRILGSNVMLEVGDDSKEALA